SVILAIGQRLDRCLRACDMIGRIGGDRFGAVLSNCPAAEVGAAAEKILEATRDTAIETPAGPIHVTVSIGVVVFPQSARTGSDAMTKADIALQKAKRSGRNTWSLYDYSERQRSHQRKNMVIAEQVQRALREERMALAFQPMVCAQTEKPVLHECLLRMIQPDNEVVAAGVFMPVVEELGLIRLVDRKVLELVVEELSRYPEAHLAMNVSGMTVMDRPWLRNLAALLRGKPEISNRLVVEITETASLDDIDECTRFVGTLRDLGCQVALDDFGAGYTSFRHLKSLAVNMVKIDGSFVRKLASNHDNLLFIRTLLDLARNFNLQTVAECVEHHDEVALLREEGVHLLQGYAFGKPSLEHPWAAKPTAPRAIAVGFGIEEQNISSAAS
ncbi:MAG: EAL domain-containing protein, partial [Alphaproteobacteria bacterium]